MTRINKNMYKMSFGNSVGVLVDEYLMKKLVKLQYKHKMEILDLLENNSEHQCYYGWWISNEPKELPQDERTFYYVDERWEVDTNRRLSNLYDLEKVKDLYKTEETRWEEMKKALEDEHSEWLRCKHIADKEVEE